MSPSLQLPIAAAGSQRVPSERPCPVVLAGCHDPQPHGRCPSYSEGYTTGDDDLSVEEGDEHELEEARTMAPATPSARRASFVASLPQAAPAGALQELPGWRRGMRVGKTGCVHRAMEQRTGRLFAVKSLDLGDSAGDEIDKLEMELKRLKALKHSHIVSYLGHDRCELHLDICFEYVPGGSMAAFVSSFGPLDEGLLKVATGALLEGLLYLHNQVVPVAHGNLKGSNVLIDCNFCVKLADFGLACVGAQAAAFSIISSLPWLAPEVVQGRAGDRRQADIWSLGCVLLEMTTAERPWGDAAPLDSVILALQGTGEVGSIGRPPIPQEMPPYGRDFAQRCLQRAPHARLDAADLLAHRFVAGDGPH